MDEYEIYIGCVLLRNLYLQNIDLPWLIELWWNDSNWLEGCDVKADDADDDGEDNDEDEIKRFVGVDVVGIEDGSDGGRGAWGSGPPWPVNAFGSGRLFPVAELVPWPLAKAAPHNFWYIW